MTQADTKSLEASEMWICSRMRNTSWKDKITNKQVLSIINNNRSIRNYSKTSSSAIAEGPSDALSQLKSCQLLH